MVGRVAAAAFVLLGCACGSQPSSEPSTPPVSSSPAQTRGVTDGAPPLLPPPAVFECDDLLISVASDDGAARIGLPPDRQIVLTQTPAASGARYSNGSDTFWDKGGEATLTVDGRTRTCRAHRDPWQQARDRGIDFRAIGQEPGWFLEIDSGRSMRLVYDYGAAEEMAPAPPPVTRDGRTMYTTRAGDRTLTVTIEDLGCHDGMSGQPFPHAVTVALGPLELRGCGRSLAPRADGWTVSADAAGPVRIGVTRAQADAALRVPLEGSLDTAECVYLRSPAAPAGVLFMQVGGLIVRVDVTRPGVPTEQGIDVGSSELDVHAAYGPGVEIAPHKYTDGRYLTVARDGHRLVFETDGQWVTRYRVGRLPEVEWVEGCA